MLKMKNLSRKIKHIKPLPTQITQANLFFRILFVFQRACVRDFKSFLFMFALKSQNPKITLNA